MAGEAGATAGFALHAMDWPSGGDPWLAGVPMRCETTPERMLRIPRRDDADLRPGHDA